MPRRFSERIPSRWAAQRPPGRPAQFAVGSKRDGEVTVDELIVGVNIALGNQTFDACFCFDPSSDFQVTINELIQGVNAGLAGCPPSAARGS